MTTSLNFMWMQAEKLDLDKNPAGTCPIPERFLRNAFKMATKFPDTHVDIWFDFYGAGGNKPSTANALNAYNLPSNIRFRALDEIPAFRNDPLFLDQHTKYDGYHSPIWSQVDYARILIVDKALHQRKNRYDHVLYADMDFDLSEKTFDILQDKGLVVLGDASQDNAIAIKNQEQYDFIDSASTFEENFNFNDPAAFERHPEYEYAALDSRASDNWFIENGLIGLSRDFQQIWRKEILPAVRDTSDSISGEARWNAFVSALTGAFTAINTIGDDLSVVFTDDRQAGTDYSDYTGSNSTNFLRTLPKLNK